MGRILIMNDLIRSIDKDELVARAVFFSDDDRSLDFDGIASDSKENIHVIVIGIDRRMLFMLRQAALLAHYINFDDETGANRTVLTLIDPSAKDNEDLKATKIKVDSKVCLGNLTKECPWSYGMLDGEKVCGNQKQSYIDIDLRIIGLGAATMDKLIVKLLKEGELQRITVIAYKDVLESMEMSDAEINKKYFQLYEVPRTDISQDKVEQYMDLCAAKKINAVYHFSNYLGDIKAGDIDNVKRYSKAVKLFIENANKSYFDKRWNELTDLSLALSNVYCSDGIKPKIRGLECGNNKKLGVIIPKYLKLLARCEHTRWNVEKLILGFRAWSAQEAYEYEFLYGSEARDYKNRKKKEEQAHIDICSNRTLRRIDVESVKYDNFMMLAIPYILCGM